MRTGLCVSLAVACLSFSACKQEDKAKQPADSSSGNPLSAPADYVGAVVKAQKSAQKTISTVGLDQAVRVFAAEEGRYPTSLDELKEKGIQVPNPPAGMKYDYNPTNGILKVVPQ